MEVKLCKDCRYCFKGVHDGYEFARCRRPTGKFSLVDGTQIYVEPEYCLNQRNLIYDNRCGPDAKYFEAKS